MRVVMPLWLFILKGLFLFTRQQFFPEGWLLVIGMVTQLSDKDETSISRKQMLARLDVAMGGRVAEELIFGENEVTSGASSDLNSATSLARAMVTKYSMGKEIGVVTHNYDDNGRSLNTETRLLVEKEVKRFLERAYNNDALLEHETLTGSQIKALLAQVNCQQQQPIFEAQCSSQSKQVPSSPNPAASAAAATAAAATAA